jgi:mono/diheme cytochrome c family protein
VWEGTCRECHGYPGPFAEALTLDRDQVYLQVTEGGGYMPAQDHLTEEEVWAVIDFMGIE